MSKIDALFCVMSEIDALKPYILETCIFLTNRKWDQIFSFMRSKKKFSDRETVKDAKGFQHTEQCLKYK